MATCPNPSGIIYNFDGKIYYTGCKRLTCPVCGEKIKSRILDDVKNGFEGERVRFCTLTLLYTGRTYEDRYLNENISKFWNRLLANIKISAKRGTYDNAGRCGKGINIPDQGLKFFYTLEPTKNNMLHYHIIWNMYIEKYILEDMWWLATNKTSWMCKPKKTEIYSPGGYMLKYLTKSIDSKIPTNIRRYGMSRNIPRSKFKPTEKFYYLPMNGYNNNIILDSIDRMNKHL